MLDKVILLSFIMFMIFLFAFMAVAGLGMFTQWGVVQNQAQFVAASMGKWGGYTAETGRTVAELARSLHLARNDVNVQVSSTGPIPWGAPVWAKLSVPFKFKVGRYNVGTFQLSGLGRSVSAYMPGAYNVRYVSP